MGATASSDKKLSPEELIIVGECWKVIMQNPEENGVAIFKAFLDKHNYYSKFEKFRGIPLSELPENRLFRNHSLAIIKAIDNVTQNINDEEKLKSLLLQLGKQHKRRNINRQQFDELKIVILDVLRSAFRLDDESLKAWNKTFDIAFVYVFQGLEE